MRTITRWVPAARGIVASHSSSCLTSSTLRQPVASERISTRRAVLALTRTLRVLPVPTTTSVAPELSTGAPPSVVATTTGGGGFGGCRSSAGRRRSESATYFTAGAPRIGSAYWLPAVTTTASAGTGRSGTTAEP